MYAGHHPGPRSRRRPRAPRLRSGRGPSAPGTDTNVGGKVGSAQGAPQHRFGSSAPAAPRVAAAAMAATALCCAALAPMMAPVASAAPAARAAGTCGSVRAGHDEALRITVVMGAVSCAEARTAARNYISGKGTFHGPSNGPRSAQYITLPKGWRCSVIHGGSASCGRNSQTRPTEAIGFELR